MVDPTIGCSVIICTRDRCRQLHEVLTSLTGLVVPGSFEWELIVVDNASRDDTAGVARSFAALLPLRVVTEPRLGLSNARNAGVQAARGRHIVWTDDDVRVHPLWLAAYADSFARFPEATVFGGKITPELMAPSPSWFRDAAPELSALLAFRDFGPEPRTLMLERGEYPYGANYAVRGIEQRACLYDPELGVAPGRRTGGEEYDVIRRAVTAGSDCRWVPAAEVRHMIPPHRQTLAYVFAYYASEGEVWARTHPDVASLMGLPTFTWYKLPVAALRFALAQALRLRSRVRFAKRLAWHGGVVRQSLARR